MDPRAWKSDALLFLAAGIWGFAFVAQRAGMEYVGPFIFNAVRFALGALTLIPLLIMNRKGLHPSKKGIAIPEIKRTDSSAKLGSGKFLLGCAVTGIVLFIGASFQQTGLVYTTAGKAGFITGLYVILVPILGLFLRYRPGIWVWFGATSAVVGLYLLSITHRFTLSPGDALVLVSAFFWAFHVLIIGWLSSKIDPIKLAFVQYAICSLLSFIAAFSVEEISGAGLQAAAIPILYGGILSVGVAYTLQVVAQQEAPPAHAAIILSLETVFAALGGWLILSERLSLRGLLGCGFMFAGFIISQFGKTPDPPESPLNENVVKNF